MEWKVNLRKSIDANELFTANQAKDRQWSQIPDHGGDDSPRFASSLTTSFPMPRLPPVITMVLPSTRSELSPFPRFTRPNFDNKFPGVSPSTDAVPVTIRDMMTATFEPKFLFPSCFYDNVYCPMTMFIASRDVSTWVYTVNCSEEEKQVVNNTSDSQTSLERVLLLDPASEEE